MARLDILTKGRTIRLQGRKLKTPISIYIEDYSIGTISAYLTSCNLDFNITENCSPLCPKKTKHNSKINQVHIPPAGIKLNFSI